MDAIRINGKIYSWDSVSLKINGSRTRSVTSIGWKDGRKRTVVKGLVQSGAPLGKTSGSYEGGTVTLAMLVDAAAVFRAALGVFAATQGAFPGNYGAARFPIALQFGEFGLLPVTYDFSGCTIDDEGGDVKEGPEGAVENITIGFLDKRVNQLPLYDRAIDLPF